MSPDATDRGRLLALRRSGDRRAARALLWRMRRRRLWQLWVRFGLAFGHVMSHLMLWILYWTLFLPFGLLGRAQRARRGWEVSRRAPAATIGELASPA